MKNYYIRSLILIAIFVLGVLFPISEWKPFLVLVMGIVPSFLIGLSVPFLSLLNLGMGSYVVRPPKWTDRLSNIKNPLTFVQFVEYFLYSWGVGLMMGELYQSQSASLLGLCLIAAGLGIKSGTNLLLKRYNA